MPICAVSLSRISPTMMTSGIGAQEGAHRLREVQSILRVDLHLAQALLRDLDRVFGGPDLAVGRVDVLSTECSVVVLPEPVGPTHRNRP